MNYTLGIGILAAVILYGCFHFIQQRRIRRNEVAIPPFLRGGDDHSDDSRNVSEDNLAIICRPRQNIPIPAARETLCHPYVDDSGGISHIRIRR